MGMELVLRNSVCDALNRLFVGWKADCAAIPAWWLLPRLRVGVFSASVLTVVSSGEVELTSSSPSKEWEEVEVTCLGILGAAVD